jgi:hypothetical protein
MSVVDAEGRTRVESPERSYGGRGPRNGIAYVEMYEFRADASVALVEAIKRYCESYNDEPQETALHGAMTFIS